MSQPITTPEPKHSHYVSIENDGIYPALSSPSGYEDEHPSEYRAATAAEIEKYKRGAETVVERALPVDLLPVSVASPTSITLAPEPPVAITPFAGPAAPPAAVAAPMPPPAPAPGPVTAAIPVPPATPTSIE